MVLLVCASLATAQEEPLGYETIPMEIDSGPVVHAGDAFAVVYSTVVAWPGASWMRLQFGETVLSGDVAAGAGAVLRITSIEDGAVQTLNAVHLRQWRFTSAYFNGDSVALELLAHPGTGENRVSVVGAMAGAPTAEPRSICGGVDDRVLSNDPRIGRGVPVGCTAWLINDCNRCLLTAGHCIDTSGSPLNVVEFNVPLSTASGAIVHPPPEDQYAVDPASIQWQTDGAGNDWGYFGVFANPVTGQLPVEAQGGGVVNISAPPPVPTGQTFRVTGYGSTSAPVSPTWYLVQKTHIGPYFNLDGTRLIYEIDTTGGNSGSPVIDEASGVAYAIHTHGGCTIATAGNIGTSLAQANVAAALAAPRGVCEAGMTFTFPQGIPSLIDPAGGTELVFAVSGTGCAEPQPGSAQMFIDSGAGFEALALEETSTNTYRAVFPAFGCYSIVRFYITALALNDEVHAHPPGAPLDSLSAVAADARTTLFVDNFQTNLGWLLQSTALLDGAWQRGVPAGDGANGDPLFDYDGSGACYLTDNTPGSSDVDGGPTRIISPVWDLSTTEQPILTYARWFSHINTSPPPPPEQDTDSLDVHLTNDNGATWVLVESETQTTPWVSRTIRIADYVTPTAQVRVRFSVADNPNNSTTEAAIDAVALHAYECGQTCTPGDIDLNAQVDGRDVAPFAAGLIAPPAPGTLQFCVMDIDGDGVLTADDDAAAFVLCLLNAACP